MLVVLNKRWLSQGWRVMDPEDSEPMALTWIESLDRAGISHEHYYELYQRGIATRARRMAQGLKCDDFSVDMMIAGWPALRDELKQRDIDARRFLPSTAASQCVRCEGTGMEQVYSITGEKLGRRKDCKHEPVSEGEGIWTVIKNQKTQIDDAIQALCKRNWTEKKDDIFNRLILELHWDAQREEDDAGRQNLLDARRLLIRAQKHIRICEKIAASPA